MLIGILLCGHAPDDYIARTGDIDSLFRKLLGGRGFTFRTWSVVDMEFPPDVLAADGWLVTGSKHGVYDDLPFIRPLEALIRDIRTARRPLVGVCFGHQIIAQALGGHVEKFAGGWTVGLQRYQGSTGDLSLYAWHQDQVIAPPEDAETLASNAGCAHAILRYGPDCITVQGHPEFGRDYIELLMELRAGLIPQDKLDVASRELDAPTDTNRVAQLLVDALAERSLA